MINCPYCHHELPDDALSCSRCKGRLMEGGDLAEARRPALSRWGYLLHPYTVLACLFVATALILVGFHKPQLKKTASAPASAPSAQAVPAPAPAAAPPPSAETDEEAGAEEVEPEAASTVEPPRERVGSKGKRGRQNQVAADAAGYERAIKDNLAKCDQLATKFNDLSRQGKGAAGTRSLNDVIGEFRTLLQQTRSLKPPTGFERAQTTLSNSIAMTRRGLRSKMLYLETGETGQLSKSQEDLESARQQREQGLSLLESAKPEPAGGKKETAPAAAPPPEKPAPPPPSKPAAKPVPPAPAQPPPAEVEPGNEPEPEEGATPAEPPEGGSQEEPQPANPEDQLPIEP